MKALNIGTGLQRTEVSSSSGDFSFQDLPLGQYSLAVTQAGFETLKVEKVEVEVGKLTSLKLTLRVASQSQTVDVAASAVVIDSETATLNEVIPDKAVQDVPLNGRDFTQLVKLAPGVNGAGSINGARISQNNWQIDGADNNDLWHNSAAVNQGGVSGVAGTLLPIDAIDQFSVQSNANAEAGRNGGGSINMVIKSGTNALHGTLYYFNRNDALAKPPLRSGRRGQAQAEEQPVRRLAGRSHLQEQAVLLSDLRAPEVYCRQREHRDRALRRLGDPGDRGAAAVWRSGEPGVDESADLLARARAHGSRDVPQLLQQ